MAVAVTKPMPYASKRPFTGISAPWVWRWEETKNADQRHGREHRGRRAGENTLLRARLDD
jgi:hypothetical protein